MTTDEKDEMIERLNCIKRDMMKILIDSENLLNLVQQKEFTINAICQGIINILETEERIKNERE